MVGPKPKPVRPLTAVKKPAEPKVEKKKTMAKIKKDDVKVKSDTKPKTDLTLETNDKVVDLKEEQVCDFSCIKLCSHLIVNYYRLRLESRRLRSFLT